MKTPREKYLQDNHYRTLVDTMRSVIEQGSFTPSEIREAAILASIMYEETHIRQIKIINPEIEKVFEGLHAWSNTPGFQGGGKEDKP